MRGISDDVVKLTHPSYVALNFMNENRIGRMCVSQEMVRSFFQLKKKKMSPISTKDSFHGYLNLFCVLHCLSVLLIRIH